MIPHRAIFKRPNLGSERPDIGSERSNLGSERPDWGSDWSDLGLEGGDSNRKLETGENRPVWNHRSSAPPGPLPKRFI